MTEKFRAARGRYFGWTAVGDDGPALRAAQVRTLAHLVPLIYFILLANAWILVAVYAGPAPDWLSFYPAATLTVIYLVRMRSWWRMRGVAQDDAAVRRALTYGNGFAVVLSAIFTAWGLLLLGYGTAAEHVYAAFFIAISVVTCMFGLVHNRVAPLAIATVSGVPFVIVVAITGEGTLMAMAANMAVVVPAMAVMLVVHHRDFLRTVHANAEARRRTEEQNRLLRMIDDMPAAVMTLEPQTLTINYLNAPSKVLLAQIEEHLPVPIDKVIGTPISSLHPCAVFDDGPLTHEAKLPYQGRINVGPEVLDIQISAVTNDHGGYLGPMITWEIVTKQVETDERIRYLAEYDTLTALPNRNTFRDRLDACLSVPGHHAGLLHVDLDGFKEVNDTQGHSVGDALLRQVAERLRQASEDCGLTVGRVGGDEFTILVSNTETCDPEKFAAEIINKVATPYAIGGRSVRIGASVGIALAPEHAGDSETLLSYADLALYAAKEAGRHTVRVFSADMETEIQERVRLETGLRAALERRDGLFVFFQPIVDIETGVVTAREALVRWHDDERGWISPGRFVPAAEQSGLIDQLGQFVLQRACAAAVGWQDGARVAVNVSAAQLGHGTVVPAVVAALEDSGLEADRLEVEVTETALLSSEADGIADLRQLHSMGVRVALDDFGTGYSSLAHLRAFPFNKIKIDGSFVRDAVDRPDCAAVVSAVAELGKRMGLTTVAEGVETEAQLERVRDEGCAEVQGYLYGRPEPEPDDEAAVKALGEGACLLR